LLRVYEGRDNLRTVILDPQRRVYRQFDGNKWKAQELAQALAEAALVGERQEVER
jgi:hypothetical protein